MAASAAKEPITLAGELDVRRENRAKNDQDPRAKLRSWLGEILAITITDGRIIVGSFACTDRDGNVILDNSSEYSPKSADYGRNPPRMLGLALVPGHHIVTVSLMT